ncbi:MAG: N(G),N(G)-dimethylarginine dimethylaminohydrolase, partial [Acidobacteriota bacterium]
RRELPAVEAALARLGSVRIAGRIESPATLEGGDVLRIGRRLCVGLSARTNAAGARRLGELLAPRGYLVEEIPVAGALHLKTAVTFIPTPGAAGGRSGLLLANPDWVECERLRAIDPDVEILPVAPGEPFAANTLTVGGTLLVSAAHPETRRRLEHRGLDPRPVDVSEFEKAEAGLTCLSLVHELPGPIPSP